MNLDIVQEAEHGENMRTSGLLISNGAGPSKKPLLN